MCLRSAASNCEFTNVDFEIEQQIVIGGTSRNIRKKSLKDPEYKLKEMLLDGRRKEFSTYQSRDIEASFKEEVIEKMSFKGKFDETRVTGNKKFRRCFNCGGEFPHKKTCPAKGKQCERCHKYNHFSSCCSKRFHREAPYASRTMDQRGVGSNENIGEIKSNARNKEISNEEDYLYLLELSGKINPYANINIQNKNIKVTIDTGASINVIDEETFHKLDNIKLRKVGIKAYTYGSREPVKFHGKFTASLESKTAFTTDEIYVVKKKECRLASEF